MGALAGFLTYVVLGMSFVAIVSPFILLGFLGGTKGAWGVVRGSLGFARRIADSVEWVVSEVHCAAYSSYPRATFAVDILVILIIVGWVYLSSR